VLFTDPTWRGLFRAMLVTAAIWWAWVGYAWLTNTLKPDEGKVRIAVFFAMGAMLIVSLSIPEVFDDHGVVFGVAYFFVRALHLVLYGLAARGDPDLLGAVLRLAPSALTGSVLLVAAGFVDGHDRYWLWVGALAIDYVGPLFGRGRGWRLHPAHFAERHALIIIIALGESVVALGLGARELPVGLGLIIAGLLGIAIVSSLWWLYFDWVAIVAEQQLKQAHGVKQAVLARDLYSYIHFPMVWGIVLFAVGLKKTLELFDEPLKPVPATALCGGLAIYLLGHVLLRYRTSRTIGHGRPVGVVALVLLFPLSFELPALATLGIATAIFVALIAYEAIRYREARRLIRGGAFATQELMSQTGGAR
jgi:low temperature requirement protein LtrA